MNNTIRIKVKSPLLRPGIELETEVSPKYVVKAVENLLSAVREINEGSAPKNEEKKA